MPEELDRLRTFLCDPDSIYDIQLLFYLAENFCQFNKTTGKIFCVVCSIEFDTVHLALDVSTNKKMCHFQPNPYFNLYLSRTLNMTTNFCVK